MFEAKERSPVHQKESPAQRENAVGNFLVALSSDFMQNLEKVTFFTVGVEIVADRKDVKSDSNNLAKSWHLSERLPFFACG